MIQAVTFDVGGTLLAPHPSVGAVYARVAAAHGFPGLSPEDLTQRFHRAWGRRGTFQYDRDDWARIVDEVFHELIPSPPSTSFFPSLYEAFAQPSAWHLYDDVLPTLEALAAQGVDLGIISNWDERLRPLLRHLRLDRYFTCFAISCEAGFAKPSPVVFGEALRQLGRPAAAVLHVGDSLNEDFAGATGAGLAALHLRRDAASHDLQIQSLLEVPRWVARATRQPHPPPDGNFPAPGG